MRAFKRSDGAIRRVDVGKLGCCCACNYGSELTAAIDSVVSCGCVYSVSNNVSTHVIVTIPSPIVATVNIPSSNWVAEAITTAEFRFYSGNTGCDESDYIESRFEDVTLSINCTNNVLEVYIITADTGTIFFHGFGEIGVPIANEVECDGSNIVGEGTVTVTIT